MQNNDIINDFLNKIENNLKDYKKISKIRVSKNLYEYMKNNIAYECKKLVEKDIPISSVFGCLIEIDEILKNMEWEVEYEK